MTKQEWPREFLDLLNSVQNKRARTVVDHILEHGQVTTEELKERYGYNHPPRAARDVREQGIPLETFNVTGTDGRRIAAYRFGDPAAARGNRLSGRTAFSSRLKRALVDHYGARCHIYCVPLPEQDLQIDHRIPFEIGGDAVAKVDDVGPYMLLCASANRAKSWSCEHCPNWQDKNVEICRTCYWAYPDDYTHVATQEVRRLDLIWSGNEADEYDELQAAAGSREEMPAFVKDILRARLIKERD